MGTVNGFSLVKSGTRNPSGVFGYLVENPEGPTYCKSRRGMNSSKVKVIYSAEVRSSAPILVCDIGVDGYM